MHSWAVTVQPHVFLSDTSAERRVQHLTACVRVACFSVSPGPAGSLGVDVGHVIITDVAKALSAAVWQPISTKLAD